jgi:hypothetical protein
MRTHLTALVVLAVALATAGSPRSAAADPGFAGLSSPRVPLSAFARPAFGLDPARLRVSTLVAVGSGFGTGTSALQVTSLSYQFRAPLWLSVSVGNSLGSGSAGSKSPFLEGLSIGWQPTRSMMFQVQYQDFRSPLQLSPASYFNRGY